MVPLYLNFQRGTEDEFRGALNAVHEKVAELAKEGVDLIHPEGAPPFMVQRLEDGHLFQLTRDGSDTTINGTSDWVYEEELGVRDGFRWSPDGKRIAFQSDRSGRMEIWIMNADGSDPQQVTGKTSR